MSENTNPNEAFLDANDLPTLRKLTDFFTGVAEKSEDSMKRITFEMYAGILGDFVRDIETGVSQ